MIQVKAGVDRRTRTRLVTSRQHLNIRFNESVLTDAACGKLNDQVRKFDLMHGRDDFLVIHQQDQIASGQGRTFIRVIEWMTDRERVHREGRDLRDSRIFELICQVRLDATECGTER